MNSAIFMLKELPLPPHEKIKKAIEKLLQTIETNEDFTETCRLLAQAINSTAIPESTKKLIEEKRDIPYQEIAKIIKEGQEEGTIIRANPKEMAVIFGQPLMAWRFIRQPGKTVLRCPSPAY
ncbi:MAG: hypothetical protein AAGU27_12195 [Dehalobacterium sp.]